MAALSFGAIAGSMTAASGAGATAVAATPGAGIIVALATIIGSYIDQQFLIPLLTRENTSAPRLDGMEISSSAYGSPRVTVLGPKVRVGGQIIFAHDVEVLSRVGSSKQGSVTTHNYFRDIAVTFAGCRTNGIRRIWGDGERIYRRDTEISVSGEYGTDWSADWHHVRNVNLGRHEARIFTLKTINQGGYDFTEMESGNYVELWYDSPKPQPPHEFLVLETRQEGDGTTSIIIDVGEYMRRSVSSGGAGINPYAPPPFPFVTSFTRLSLSTYLIQSISVGSAASNTTTITMASSHYRVLPWEVTINGVIGPNAASINGTHNATPVTGQPTQFTIEFGVDGNPAHSSGQAPIQDTLVVVFTAVHGKNLDQWFKVNLKGTSATTAPFHINGTYDAAASDNTTIRVDLPALPSNASFSTAQIENSIHYPYPYLKTATGIMVSNEPVFEFTQVHLFRRLLAWRAGVVDETQSAFYNGSSTQDVDPVIKSRLLDAEVSAYRGETYALMKKLALDEFGSRGAPNFTAEIEGQGTTVADGIAWILEKEAGWTEGVEFDLSSLREPGFEVTLRGYKYRGSSSILQKLGPLLIVGDVVTKERAGQLIFLRSNDVDEVLLDRGELGARAPDDEFGDSIRVVTVSERNLPRVIVVNYSNVLDDHQPGSEKATRRSTTSDQTLSIDLSDVSLTPTEANAIAYRLLQNAWGQRRRVFISLPPERMLVEETDILIVPDAMIGDYRISVQRIEVGALDFRVEIEGVIKSEAVTFKNVEGDLLDGPIETVEERRGGEYFAAAALALEVIDIAALSDSHLTIPGYYTAVSRYDRNAPSRNFALFRSKHGATDFDQAPLDPSEATMGHLLDGNVLAVVSGAAWDNVSTIDVELLAAATLETRSEADVLSGANMAVIGSEVVAFKTASIISVSGRVNVWRLSGFLRGQLGTEDEISSHTDAQERFVLIDDALEFHALNLIDIGSEHLLVPVGAGGTFDAETDGARALSHTVLANNAKPWPVAQVGSTRDGSDNLDLTWVRRTRSTWRTLAAQPFPLVEGVESYEVDVLDDADAVVRTIAITSPAASYTAAQQTTDGLTVGDPVTFKIYQLSPTTGRGRVKTVTVQ